MGFKMENTIYIGLSRQMTLRSNMDMVANNVANMSTPGYRGQVMMFNEYLSRPRGQDDSMSFVLNRGQYQLTKPGPISTTGNPLDIALNGPGFIGVQGPGDEIAYTRAGNFQIDPNGTLITPAGYPVAGQGGGLITIPLGSSEVNIDENGVVSNENGELGQIMLTEFENIQTLNPEGYNLYTSTEDGQPATQTIVKQGHLEGSNIEPVLEMTRMIDTLRSYQSVQTMLQGENERLRNAIQKLTEQ